MIRIHHGNQRVPPFGGELPLDYTSPPNFELTLRVMYASDSDPVLVIFSEKLSNSSCKAQGIVDPPRKVDTKTCSSWNLPAAFQDTDVLGYEPHTHAYKKAMNHDESHPIAVGAKRIHIMSYNHPYEKASVILHIYQ